MGVGGAQRLGRGAAPPQWGRPLPRAKEEEEEGGSGAGERTQAKPPEGGRGWVGEGGRLTFGHAAPGALGSKAAATAAAAAPRGWLQAGPGRQPSISLLGDAPRCGSHGPAAPSRPSCPAPRFEFPPLRPRSAPGPPCAHVTRSIPGPPAARFAPPAPRGGGGGGGGGGQPIAAPGRPPGDARLLSESAANGHVALGLPASR